MNNSAQIFYPILISNFFYIEYEMFIYFVYSIEPEK